jgi:hypothetical protein
MALTRLQIINEGLANAGRTDLLTNGRLWLNLFLEKVYKNQDLQWCTKFATLAMTDGIAQPADYLRMKSANILVAGVASSEITSCTDDEYMSLKRRGSSSGQPTKVFIDQDSRVFKFWPVPDTSYSWELCYFYLPTIPTHTDNTGDGAYPKWIYPDDVLVKAIEKKVLYFGDDKRYSQEEQALMQELSLAKMNSSDTRGGSHKMRLGKSFRRRW